MKRVARAVVAAVICVGWSERANAACTVPTGLYSDVGINVSTIAARASAPGHAKVIAEDGSTCFDYSFSATIRLVEDSSTAYVMSSSALGEYVATLDAPAHVGSCYSSTINASRSAMSSSDADGPLCWSGPPDRSGPIEPVRDPDSPIILDLGDAYRLTSAAAGVRFDLRNEGRDIQVAWTMPGAENAFLALDRNNNGVIDSGAELFGNFTPLQTGGAASHGFEALAELDDNGDGSVDAADSAWPALLLWTDRNHDGRSSVDELQPISSSAVAALETPYRLVGKRDRWGNTFRYMSHFRLRHGGGDIRRAYYDVFLVTDGR